MGHKNHKSLLLFSVVLGVLVSVVSSFPRGILIAGDNRRSDNLVSSVLSDYWSERGFKDASDHLMASESRAKELMLTGDEITDFQGTAQIRIPRERLMPPTVNGVSDSVASRQNRRLLRPTRPHSRSRVPLTPAQKKQDMEVLESVTIVDGGILQNGKIVQPTATVSQSQRKYHIAQGGDPMSPLSYQFPRESSNTNTPYHSSDLQPQTSISTSYHTLPHTQNAPSSPYHTQQQLFPPLPIGKPSAVQKGPRVEQPRPLSPLYSPLSVTQFREHLLQHQQEQPIHPFYFASSTTTTTSPPPPSPKPTTIYVLPSPSQKPSILQQQQQQNSPFNTQLFQQQFQHPFQPSQTSSLAQLTASILSAASGAAAAASAAANALKQSELAQSAPTVFPPSLLSSLTGFSVPNAMSLASLAQQQPQPQTQAPPTQTQPRYPHHQLQLSHASSQVVPQVVSTASASSLPASETLRPGVVIDDAPVLENQVVEPENLATKLTKIYETGKKILYFPKGVVDTVDTILKQMERNPTVAYWGDKFFAKVFGDTSGT